MAAEDSSSQQPRVLCCLFGELRGVYASAASVRDHVLDPLGADVLVLCQRQLPDDEDRLTYLAHTVAPHPVVLSRLYDKPDPREEFGRECFEDMQKVKGNFLNAGNCQVLINHKRLGDCLMAEGLLASYDFILFTRSDFLHLVPFPSACTVLAALGPYDVVSQAGHEFGGVNYNLTMMRSAVAYPYLSAPYDALTGKMEKFKKKPYNIELFWRAMLAGRNLNNVRMNATCFVTAESLGDRTTWKKIKSTAIDNDGVLYKYEPQMKEAQASLEYWRKKPEWHAFNPPLALQVMSIHGRANRPFALVLSAALEEESLNNELEDTVGDDQEGVPTYDNGVSEVDRFHVVPRKGWDRFIRSMRCSARNLINWQGFGEPPTPPSLGCWILASSDKAAFHIADQQETLKAMGWRVLTPSPEVILDLSDKWRLRAFAECRGLLKYMPTPYLLAEAASYPCILKSASGEYGKDCHIVGDLEEVHRLAPRGLGERWVLQELIVGRLEYAVSVLVDDSGIIRQVVGTQYEYEKDVYVWPHVRLVGKAVLENIPSEHMETMALFLTDYKGICNFNYKVRPCGTMAVFEINTRIGGDLAVDAPRQLARNLYEGLDKLVPKKAS